MRVIVSVWLCTLAWLAGAAPAAGQATPQDTAAPRDTAAMPGRDSVRPPGDSAPAAPAAAPALEPSAPPPPVDSALRTACGKQAAPTLAPDLLVIVFNPGVDGPARAAVAGDVGGSLVERTGSGMADAYYLKVPAKGSDSRLRTIVDRLIVRPEVRQVGTRLCPAPPSAPAPPPTPAPKGESK